MPRAAAAAPAIVERKIVDQFVHLDLMLGVLAQAFVLVDGDRRLVEGPEVVLDLHIASCDG